MEEENKIEEKEKTILEKVNESAEKKIEEIINQGLAQTNVDYLYKLVDIHKDIANEKYWKVKEEYYMYRGYDEGGYSGEYGARRRDSRGRYMEGNYSEGNYGRRGVPGTGRGRYRGEEMMENMYQAYQDYIEGKEMYGADMNTMKALKYILKLDKKFIEMLDEEAQTPEEKELIAQHKMEMAEM